MSTLETLISKDEMETVLDKLVIAVTLDERGNDHLDFPEINVHCLDDALSYVYSLGIKHTINQQSSTGV